MIHYTCDLCQRSIEPRSELRYVVKMEVYAAVDESEADDLCEEEDHLEEIQDILQRIEDGEDDCLGDDVYKTMRFDLCAACRQKFLKNPLAREVPKQFDFSEN